MAKNTVEITGINTSELKTLSDSEMIELFNLYKNGDKSAKEKLVKANIKLVLSILKRYKNKTDNLDDLFQIGCVGLIKAIDNFDLSYEVKFSTYAVLMIEGEVKRYNRDNNQLRVSRSIRELAYKIIAFKENYFNMYSKYPSNDDICKNFSISPYELSIALQSLSEVASIFEPIFNDGGDTIYLLDQIEDTRIRDIDITLSLKKALGKLKDREKDILIKRYVVGTSQIEIASSLGISQAQVSRLENKALENVRKLMM